MTAATARTPADSETVESAEPDGGMVTAELAMALPTLMLVLAVALYALAAVSEQGRCVDAAYAVAHGVARGDDAAAVRTRLLAALPHGSTIRVAGTGPHLVTAQVDAPLPAPAGLRFAFGGRLVSAHATAADETSP